MSLTEAEYMLELLPKIHPMREKNGYEQIKIDGKWQWFHRVIAEYKLADDIFEGFEVHHIDGNKKNNHPSNLLVLSKEEHRELHRKQKEQESEPDPVVMERAKNLITEWIESFKQQEANKRAQVQQNELLSIQQLNKTLKSRISRHKYTSGYTKGSYSEDQPCSRCGGSGYLSQYDHVEGGVCFSCGGTGWL